MTEKIELEYQNRKTLNQLINSKTIDNNPKLANALIHNIDTYVKYLGSPIKLAFDYNNAASLFNSNNWQDPIVLYLRNIISWRSSTDERITQMFDENQMTLIQSDDQTTISFNQPYFDDSAVITWYKDRGRTEKILDWELNPISLENFIDIFNQVTDLTLTTPEHEGNDD